MVLYASFLFLWGLASFLSDQSGIMMGGMSVCGVENT
jgi:hypothetical protein